MSDTFRYPTDGKPSADIRDAAISFEAVKLKLNQDKNGHVLTLSIHPNDIPDELLRSWVGTRYTVAMVELNDQDEPVLSEAQQEGIKAVQLAGILCRDPQFQHWISMETDDLICDEEDCKNMLCSVLGIDSRKALKEDMDVRKVFMEMKDSFYKWRES